MADKSLNNLRNEGLDGIGGDATKLKKTMAAVLNSSSTEKLAMGKPFNQTDLANYKMFTEAAERLGTDKMTDGEIEYYRMAKEISNYSGMSAQEQATIRQKAAEVSAGYWGTGSAENQKMIKGNIVTELGVAGTAVDYSNGSAKNANASPIKSVAGQGNAGMTLEQGYKAGREAIIKNSGKDVAAGQKREYDDSLASTEEMAAATNFNAYNINMHEFEFDTAQLYRVFGMPYQWMDIADRRIPGTNIGRTFGAKIASKIPLLILTPGLPEFLAGYSSKEKNALIQKLSGGADGISLQSLADGIIGKGKETKYYQLRFAKKEYFTYVNAMTNALAAYLGISDEDSPYGGKIGNFDWSTLTSSSSLSRQLSYYGAVAFYLNSETSISESFSNDTTQSQLAAKVNEMSGMVRELQFITGLSNISFYDNANTDSGNVINNTASGNNAGDSMFGGIGSFIDNLKTGAKTVFAGGKLVFPEIWSDSSHSVSYTVNIKLTTPDFDKYSWFLNIGAPLIHLICMSAPRQMGANGYASPFLVRAFYKGFFSIDSGMIGSLSITKGTDGGWTIDGLPTVVDVSIDIKDLYHSMNIIAPDVIGDLSGNLSMESSLKNVNALTYLANMAGVNINQTDIGRAFRLAYWSMTGQAKQLLSNGPMQALTQSVMNRILHMYN